MKANCTFLITCFALFPFICFSQEKSLGEKFIRQYESGIFFPLMSYESAYNEGGHTLGLHLPDYIAIGSLKYNYADSANYSITLGAGLFCWQVGFQKQLFSVWNRPVNIKLTAGFFGAGIYGDTKLLFGLYKNEKVDLTGILTYGKYGMLMGHFINEKYFQYDLFYRIRISKKVHFGFGGGGSTFFYEDHRDPADTDLKVKSGKQSRFTWQGSFSLQFKF